MKTHTWQEEASKATTELDETQQEAERLVQSRIRVIRESAQAIADAAGELRTARPRNRCELLEYVLTEKSKLDRHLALLQEDFAHEQLELQLPSLCGDLDSLRNALAAFRPRDPLNIDKVADLLQTYGIALWRDSDDEQCRVAWSQLRTGVDETGQRFAYAGELLRTVVSVVCGEPQPIDIHDTETWYGQTLAKLR